MVAYCSPFPLLPLLLSLPTGELRYYEELSGKRPILPNPDTNTHTHNSGSGSSGSGSGSGGGSDINNITETLQQINNIDINDPELSQKEAMRTMIQVSIRVCL